MPSKSEPSASLTYQFEPMNEIHREAVINIFNEYITNSFAAFLETPVPYQFFDQFLAMTQGYPAFVVRVRSGAVVGFAFLHPYHPASTFHKTAEISYFLADQHTGKGIGSILLDLLTQKARELGIEVLLACISSRNEGSIHFHNQHGFCECGVFRNIGQKFGHSFDVVWMQKDLTQVETF